MSEYSDGFFDAKQNGAVSSARVIVPLLLPLIQPNSVIDIGCGRGAWLKAFHENGVQRIKGVDGGYVDSAKLLVPRESFSAMDLSGDFQLDGRYDLAVCLEVAEHLPTTRAPNLIRQLATVAPFVLFSAAIPGQGGTHHINEQPPSYWRSLFAHHGFALLDPIRPAVQNDERVVWWYRQNTVLYANETVLSKWPLLAKHRVPADKPAIEWIHVGAMHPPGFRALSRAFVEALLQGLWRRINDAVGHVAAGMSDIAIRIERLGKQFTALTGNATRPMPHPVVAVDDVLLRERTNLRGFGMSDVAIRVEGLDQPVQLGVRSSRTWRALKSVASFTHRLAAANPQLASWYVSLYRSLQLLPDGHWKEFILNSIQSVRWPTVALSPARVRLLPGLEAWVVPHLGEFDFTAHMCRGLNYESETAAWFRSRQYDVIIEIGANVGVYTLLFAKLFPSASVYAFEPSRAAYRRLLENLALNHCRNVIPFNCAITGRTGFIEFFEPSGHLTNGSLDRSFAGIFAEQVDTALVPAMRGTELDGLCLDGKRLLLKIDVEGSEPLVLRGLESIISSRHPDIVIEVLPNVAVDLNKLEFLQPYRLFQLTTMGPVETFSFTSRLELGHRDYALVAK